MVVSCGDYGPTIRSRAYLDGVGAGEGELFAGLDADNWVS